MATLNTTGPGRHRAPDTNRTRPIIQPAQRVPAEIGPPCNVRYIRRARAYGQPVTPLNNKPGTERWLNTQVDSLTAALREDTITAPVVRRMYAHDADNNRPTGSPWAALNTGNPREVAQRWRTNDLLQVVPTPAVTEAFHGEYPVLTWAGSRGR